LAIAFDWLAVTETIFRLPIRSQSTGFSFIETHFEGISSVKKNAYTLSDDSMQEGSSIGQGSFVTVRRNQDGTFGAGSWVNLNYSSAKVLTSANAVYGNQVVGIVAGTNELAF
jgi:hypothetical protein